MRYTTALLLFALISINLMAQPQVIEVWNGPIPGSIPNANYVTVTDSNDNWIKARMVGTPTLDYYPAESTDSAKTAVIICPGGGYWGLAIDHEGKQIALWLNSIGVSAFVLKYRLPSPEIMKDPSVGPLQDAQEAIRLVRRNAGLWHIAPQKIGIMGFSAGGHLASTAATHFSETVYPAKDSTSARPDFALLIYPVITMDTTYTHRGSHDNLIGKNPTKEQVVRFSNELQVSAQTPPSFLIHSIDDQVVPFQNSLNFALAMKEHGISCELHLFEKGGHGYGMGRSKGSESTWPSICQRWLTQNGF